MTFILIFCKWDGVRDTHRRITPRVRTAMQRAQLSTDLPELLTLNSCHRSNIALGDIWQGERELGACPSWGRAELRGRNKNP